MTTATAEPTTDIELGTLTRDDLKALRQCDRAVFGTDRGESQGYIRCVKELKKRGPFDDDEREHRIECEAYGTVYGGGGLCDSQPLRDSGRRAFELVYNYEHAATPFGTFAALARPGDSITLHWTGAGGNQYEERAGLCRDSLSIEITRGKHRFTFLLDVSVCPDNSARMISR